MRVPTLVVSGLLLCAAMFLGGAGATSAQSADVGARIVAVAMADLGTYQGECFPWARSVVASATGIPMGFGYRDGYLEGGAVEVPLSEVRAGDVVQVADDADLGPGADYPGLHTAIVIEQLPGGVLRVIDSNSQWDGIVRIRDDYNPLASGATYPYLTARAYRFSMVADGFVEGSQLSLTPGGSAMISADGDCLRLRATPGTAGSLIRCIPDGTVVSVLDGTQDADGFTWQRIRAGSDEGWVASIFLVATGSAPPPAATPTSTPTPTPQPAQQPTSNTGAITGELPTGGGPGLVVWGGGSTNTLVVAAGSEGCFVRSLWVTVDGAFVGYTNGAPGFVNAGWNARYPGDIPPQSPLIVICGGGQSPPSSPPSSSPNPPQDGDPPGPAGND